MVVRHLEEISDGASEIHDRDQFVDQLAGIGAYPAEELAGRSASPAVWELAQAQRHPSLVYANSRAKV